MADFSIQDAAFTGFGVVREHRGYLAAWAGLALVASFTLTSIIVVVAGPAVMSLQSLTSSGSHDPAIVFPLLGRLAPLYLVLIPAVVVLYGVLNAAMNRAVLRPGDHKFAYFAFGADELRQIGLLFVSIVVFAVLYFAVVVGIALVTSLVGSFTHASPAFSGLMAVALAFAAMIWLAVRLSLASALTFASRRVTLFGSWVLTKGRFWPIFGAYVMALALAAVILLLTSLVILATVAVATGGNLLAASAPADMRSLGAYFTVGQLVQVVLGAGVSALMWPVVLTPPAAIFRQITLADGNDAPAPWSK